MARVALDIVSALVNEEPDKVYVACIILNCDSRNIISLSLFLKSSSSRSASKPTVMVPRSKCLRPALTVLTQRGLKIAGRRPLQIVKSPSETVPKQTGRDMQSFFPFNSPKKKKTISVEKKKRMRPKSRDLLFSKQQKKFLFFFFLKMPD